jgi:hypothetical protein
LAEPGIDTDVQHRSGGATLRDGCQDNSNAETKSLLLRLKAARSASPDWWKGAQPSLGTDIVDPPGRLDSIDRDPATYAECGAHAFQELPAGAD